jgi:hypothetical protein
MHRTLALIILCFGMSILGGLFSSLPAQISRAEATVCDTNQLPSEIRDRLRTDFGTWKAQAPDNLSQKARLSWAGKKGTGCPGIALGFFRSARQTSYAVLLVPSEHPDAAYRFVVFSPKVENSAYEELIVEKSDDHGASNFFIQKVPVSKFFDETSKKKFQVQTTEAILMIDSAENEYEADVYFWANNKFQQEPVDY